MPFRMFSSHNSPIAIDFGAASVKLLQVEPGEKPVVIAAAEVAIPDAVRDDAAERMTFLVRQLPAALKRGGFRGRRAVCALPTAQTVLQHVQLAIPEGVRLHDAANSQIHLSLSKPPGSLVVRAHEVAQVTRDGSGTRTEVLCLAIPRDLIMRHIALLDECRLEATGMHAQPSAMVRAFDHIHRREGDENLTTMYIDLGWSCTCVAIAHGGRIVFARAIQIGGRHFDELIAKALQCDAAGARAHRLSLIDSTESAATVDSESPAIAEATTAVSGDGGLARLTAAMASEGAEATSGGGASPPALSIEDRRSGLAAPVIARSVEPGEGHTSAANVDFTEVLETIADELSMCLRYHRGLFPGRAFDRVVLLGGEARQNWLGRRIAKALRLPARLGDPLARLTFRGRDVALDRSQPQPGWATACGLCAESADARA